MNKIYLNLIIEAKVHIVQIYLGFSSNTRIT